MPIKPEEVLEYIGIDTSTIENMEAFKEQFSKRFFTKESVVNDKEVLNHLFGRTFGELQTEVKRRAKDDLGVELTAEDSAKPLKELLPVVFEKAKTSFADQLTKAQGKPDEKVAAIQSQLEKTAKSLNELKALHESTVTDYTTKLTQKEQEVKTTKLNMEVDSVMRSLKLRQGLSPIEEKGFRSVVTSELRFDYDENNKLIVTDQSGNRIKNTEKAGTFYEPADAVKAIALREKLWENSPKGGRALTGLPITGDPSGDRKPVNQVAQAYLRNTGQ